MKNLKLKFAKLSWNGRSNKGFPNVSEHSIRNLDENGVVKIGTWVDSGDILVGKLTPKGESDYPPEGKLFVQFLERNHEMFRNTSLKLPHGTCGRVLDVKIFSTE